MPFKCVNATNTTCQLIVNKNVTDQNKRFFETHDLKLFYIRGIQGYEGIPKIPKSEYSILEKDFILYFDEYEGVPYVTLQKRRNPVT